MKKFRYIPQYFIKIYCKLVPGGLDGWYFPSMGIKAVTYWSDNKDDLHRLAAALRNRFYFVGKYAIVHRDDYPKIIEHYYDYGFYLEDISIRIKHMVRNID